MDRADEFDSFVRGSSTSRRFAALPLRPPAAFQDTDALAAADAREPLIMGLENLPVRQRSAVVLRYWEDLSEAATADVMGCSGAL